MRFLFIAPLPPPITGQSIASQVLNKELVKFHHVQNVNLSKESLKNGMNSLFRIMDVVKHLFFIWNKQKNFDVIYLTVSESIAGNIKDLLIYLICFKNLNKLVIHVHGGSLRIFIFDKSKLLFKINKYFIQRIAGAIVLGPSHKSIFSDFVSNDKIHIVTNFAEDFLFLEEKEVEENFANTHPLKILFLSNLISGKGYNELVDAYFSLDDDIKRKIVVNFAGGFESAVQKENFLQKIKGAAGINYHGIISGIEKRNMLMTSHIFCLPTCLNEGQPISILEAYASGCVVLTTNQGGIPDIFTDGLNGFEIQKMSSDSIKHVIERIVEKPGQLLPIAIFNRNIAFGEYRAEKFNKSLIHLLERIGSQSKNINSKNYEVL